MLCEGEKIVASLVFDKSAPHPTETGAESERESLVPKRDKAALCGCLITANTEYHTGNRWSFWAALPRVEFHLGKAVQLL